MIAVMANSSKVCNEAPLEQLILAAADRAAGVGGDRVCGGVQMRVISAISRLWHKLFGYKCPDCEGAGYVINANGLEMECRTCEGKGRLKHKPRTAVGR